MNHGSPKDDTYGEIQRLGEDYANVKGVNLLRNFGQHNALDVNINMGHQEIIFLEWMMICRLTHLRSVS
ncbi:MAG: hypothetical protein V8T31_09880 [Lachnospiraceae bacterium]